jgi:hypothetical protein
MVTCDECKLTCKKENSCMQWLGESIGWQWFPRTNDSYKDCHFNHCENSSYDPYEQYRKEK